MTVRSSRGFSLIEVMMSLAVLSVGVLGVAQMQILASNQNGLARRTNRASAIARDFVETASRWEYRDPRLAPTGACGAAMPVYSDATLTDQRDPPAAAKMDFTALNAGFATSLATTTNALEGLGMPYSGLAKIGAGGLLGDPVRDQYQLNWSVRNADLNTSPQMPGCEGKLITVVVRYPVGNGRVFKNLITTFIKYDNRLLGQNGTPEQM